MPLDLTQELRARVEDHADDPHKLLEVLYDMTTWSEDDLADAQRTAIELLTAHVDDLSERTPSKAPTTDAQADSKDWPDIGLLGALGYKVRKSGKPEYRRRSILRVAFERDVTPYVGEEIAAEWGKPNTVERLQKMVQSLGAFSRNARNRNDRRLDTAIQHWDQDVQFLKREFSDLADEVRWPDMKPDTNSDNAPQTGDLFRT